MDRKIRNYMIAVIAILVLVSLVLILPYILPNQGYIGTLESGIDKVYSGKALTDEEKNAIRQYIKKIQN